MRVCNSIYFKNDVFHNVFPGYFQQFQLWITHSIMKYIEYNCSCVVLNYKYVTWICSLRSDHSFWPGFPSSLCHPACSHAKPSETGGEIWLRLGPGGHTSQSAIDGPWRQLPTSNDHTVRCQCKSHDLVIMTLLVS